MKTLTKAQRIKQDLNRHYAFLEHLSEFLGDKQDGKKLSLKLWKLEKEANKKATDYCNGENGMDYDGWEDYIVKLETEIHGLFASPVYGLHISGDARGYTIKIDDDAVREYYPRSIGFHLDMGGYGILSPEIGGN